MKIKHLKCTCESCPTQWEGTTEDGEAIYIRYRWGQLTIDVSSETIYSKQIGDGFDGLISLENVMKIIEGLK